MVESNVTLEADQILSILNSPNDVQPNKLSPVILSHSELVAECLLIRDESTCNCSTGYIWSNPVCYNYNCCREAACRRNVSDIVPLCVAKVNVHLKGSVTFNETWDLDQTAQLVTSFAGLNGFNFLNVTGQRESNTVADFEAAVSVKFPMNKLLEIMTNLENKLGAVLKVDTEGMVTIEAPKTPVCYSSSPLLKCTFEEMTDDAGWSKKTMNESLGLNTGSVVKLNNNCATQEYKSCIAVTLHSVTGLWSGLYECAFSSGSVRNLAKTTLTVLLLPDDINLDIEPLSVDCSEKTATDSVTVRVITTISNSTESYNVWWTFMGIRKDNLYNTSDGYNLVYRFTVDVSCQKILKSQEVSVYFENIIRQNKNATVAIPVVYRGAPFCKAEYDATGVFWPICPAAGTLINRTCAPGRVGYKTRSCGGTTWQESSSFCVDEELNTVSNAADYFLMGLGATEEGAVNIFSGLKNSSTVNSDSPDSIADINQSIDVLDVMSKASDNFSFQESIFPNFVEAASNILNRSWTYVNQSRKEDMAANYLQSVEGLTRNINVNNSKGFLTENLDLKFCSGSDCNATVFGIGVNLNETDGIMKAVAIKNLTNKLKNNFHETQYASLILSATLQKKNKLSVKIELDFPLIQPNGNKPYCVFWNTSEADWSDAGCAVKYGNADSTVCECNHLTSFSVLMAKRDISTDDLEMITKVGLGVSICCLLIFLTIEYLVWSAVVQSNLSHFRHTAIVNIATFLLLADCSFLVPAEKFGENWCLFFTVCKHLFFLGMFSWTLCLSVMLVHQLIFVFNPLRKRVFMFLSSIVGYVCPILIVGSSYVFCEYTEKPYYNNQTCWLVFNGLLDGSIHAFLLPVSAVIFTNLFSMVVVIVTLLKSSVTDGSKSDDKETAKGIVKVVVILTPVFGITWIIGFALLLLKTENPLYPVANYSFTILNSFQGLFLLLTGCFAEKKVRDEMMKLIKAKSKGNNESTKNLTSTNYTKDK
ncbi:adhesion G-protein coupled receptor F3 isoform 2-T4 [Spinachia spinachia]